ncbi:Ig-like domain-containing protein [Hyalangium rubrum]|uniref:Ig-like domain-containing protein n=1 Tax=Hyalangium rubrum TaxID=3103134 RepID=A0ABU5HBM5_9BACT|nr:Ig-like domain-containing protein [Hyalangium sp. s54d21]MDY7230233.1 Ig-like domain-containing protein [Hyalangium sp. s54d21]
MIPTKPLFLSAVVLLTACINLPDIDAPQAEIQVVTPSETAYTNGTLELKMEVTGAPPDKVELLAGDEVLATLDPPYSFQWDTTSVPEGRYRIMGRVHIAGQSFTSAAREVVVDRTAPQVVSRTPTPGAQNVSIHERIQVVFSEPIQFSTTPQELMHLTQNSLDIPCTASLSADGNSVTVTPLSALSAPSTATLTLNGSVTDLAGNTLPHPSDPWAWQLPSWLIWGPIDGATAPATNASLANYELDNLGNPVVAWAIPSSPADELHLYRWEGAWTHLGGDLSAYPGNTPASEVSISIDNSAQTFVIWRENDGTSNKILVRRWNSSSWAPLSGDATTPLEGFWPQLKFDPSGNLVLTRAELRGTSNWFCTHRWTESQWEAIGDCINSRTASADAFPVLTFRNTGHPALGWISPKEASSNILYYYWNGSTWIDLADDAGTEFDQYVAYGSYLSLQTTTSGHPLVVWTEKENDRDYIQTHLWSATQWLPLGSRIAVNSSNPPNYAVVIEESGTPLLAWSRYTLSGLDHQLHVWRWADNEWRPISEPLVFESLRGNIRIHPNKLGHILISWVESRGGSTAPRVHFRRFNR